MHMSSSSSSSTPSIPLWACLVIVILSSSPSPHSASSTGSTMLGGAEAVVVANYTDFCDRGGLQLALDCVKEGEVMYVTQQRAEKQGAMWLEAPVDVSGGFTVEFAFSAHGQADSHGDGLAFVIQSVDTSVVGANGGNVGYGGLAHALVFEMDTHVNPEYLDPNGNHISFHVSTGVNGSEGVSATEVAGQVLSLAGTGVTLYDGKTYTARVSYAGTTLTAEIDSIAATLLTMPNFDINERLGLAGGSAFVGFTAATGGSAESHVLHSWSIDLPAATECLPGFSSTGVCTKTPTSSNCNAYKACSLCTQGVACCAWCDSGCAAASSSTSTCLLDNCPTKHKHSVVWWGIGIVVGVLCLCVIVLFIYWRRTRTRSHSTVDPILNDSTDDAQAQYSQL